MRLYMLVEGPTEEQCLKRILVPHLRHHGVETACIIVETKRDQAGRKYRGGGDWTKWRADLKRLLGQHPGNDVRVTTMFDLYGLPDHFPGLEEHGRLADTKRRVGLLESALKDSLADSPGHWRIIPYLQRHEFEALVLAGLDQLDELLDTSEDLAGLAALKREVAGKAPEDVNDGTDSSPSHRLTRRIPSYQKTLHGPLAVEDLGLARLRAACPRFDSWIGSLEALGAAGLVGD